MSWVAVGSAAAVVVGGLIQSDATTSASNKQQAGSKAALDEQARQFNTTQSQTAPFRSAGAGAINMLRSMVGNPDLAATGGQVQYGGQTFSNINELRQSLINDYITKKGFDPSEPANAAVAGVNDPAYQASLQAVLDKATPVTPGGASPADTSPLLRKFNINDFWNDPVVQASYQSGLDLGTKALKNAAPLTTGLDSGAALKEITKFGTDYTGNMAAGSQARFVADQGNVYNRLASMAGLGQTAVAESTQAGMNNANNSAAILTSQANASGAARIAQGNTMAGGINNIANWWQQQAMIDKLNAGRTQPSPNYSTQIDT